MNLLDANVVQVLSEPYEKYNHWWVDVFATCWSNAPYKTELMFRTKEEAEAVQPGFPFLT